MNITLSRQRLWCAKPSNILSGTPTVKPLLKKAAALEQAQLLRFDPLLLFGCIEKATVLEQVDLHVVTLVLSCVNTLKIKERRVIELSRLTFNSPCGLFAIRSFHPSPAARSDLTSCLDFYTPLASKICGQ